MNWLYVSFLSTAIPLWIGWISGEVVRIRNKVEEHDETAKQLLTECLHTGALRCDEHRELYLKCCEFTGEEPYVV